MTPANVILRIAVIIFLSEGVIMLGLSLFDPIPSHTVEAFIDAAVLTMLSSPLTYFWVIRPFINARNQAVECLQKAHDELEGRVEERTRELTEDIKRREQAEKALQESKEELNRHVMELMDTESRLEAQGAEVAQMAEDLALAKEEAEQASRAKSAFLATMSHELRTPLNAVIGFSQMMKGKVFGPLGDAHYEEYARDILSSGEHLLSLINDVLDLSKVEAGKQELNEGNVDISDIIASSIDLVRERAGEASVELESNLPESLPVLFADGRILKQVMLNLLSNAVKFTPEGGKVTVSAGLNSGGSFRMAVADTGVGIAEEDIEAVMTPFGQVDSNLAHKHKGTGLGVPLAKEFVEMHGGTFRLESEVGVGTTASIILPAERVLGSQ